MTEREKEIEAYLVNQVRKAGGLAWKFTSPGTRGVPDRWCILNGKAFFVELKRPGTKRRADEKLQDHRSRQLMEQGAQVYKIHSKDGVNLLLKWLKVGHYPEPERIAAV